MVFSPHLRDFFFQFLFPSAKSNKTSTTSSAIIYIFIKSITIKRLFRLDVLFLLFAVKRKTLHTHQNINLAGCPVISMQFFFSGCSVVQFGQRCRPVTLRNTIHLSNENGWFKYILFFFFALLYLLLGWYEGLWELAQWMTDSPVTVSLRAHCSGSLRVIFITDANYFSYIFFGDTVI